MCSQVQTAVMNLGEEYHRDEVPFPPYGFGGCMISTRVTPGSHAKRCLSPLESYSLVPFQILQLLEGSHPVSLSTAHSPGQEAQALPLTGRNIKEFGDLGESHHGNS